VTERPGFRFAVEETFRVSKRTFILALGTLEHGVIRMRDSIELRTPEGETFSGTVETVEMHSLPGKVTIGIGGPAADHLAHGAVIEPQPIDHRTLPPHGDAERTCSRRPGVSLAQNYRSPAQSPPGSKLDDAHVGTGAVAFGLSTSGEGDRRRLLHRDALLAQTQRLIVLPRTRASCPSGRGRSERLAG
jgi:hypothetical protein